MALLKNANTGSIIATRVDRAKNAFDRMIGLLARPRVRPDEGMWIRSNAIHTIGMRATIDVIFLDDNDDVVALHPRVAPHRFMLHCRKAVSVIELGAGALDAADVLIGDRLVLTSQPA